MSCLLEHVTEVHQQVDGLGLTRAELAASTFSLVVAMLTMIVGVVPAARAHIFPALRQHG